MTGNLDQVHKIIESINHHDFEAMFSYYSDDVVGEWEGGKFDRKTMQESWAGWSKAFPDGRFDIVKSSVLGNIVFVEWTSTGTNTGSLMGVPPTGKKLEVVGVFVYEFEKGKVNRFREYYNVLGVNQMEVAIKK